MKTLKVPATLGYATPSLDRASVNSHFQPSGRPLILSNV